MADRQAIHEHVGHHDVERGSDRNFGITFAVVCALLTALALWRGRDIVWIWGPLTIAFAAVTLARPQLLRPLNQLWFKFGMLLNKVVAPLVMLVIFLVAVTPTGIILRAMGKDPLRLKRDAAARTYWIERTPHGPAPESMRRQF